MSDSAALRPCLLVLFGASGDLTARKLVPALYHLAKDGLLPREYYIVGTARRPKTDEQFRQEMRDAIAKFARTKPVDDDVWAKFAPRVCYESADVTDATSVGKLEQRLRHLEAQLKPQGAAPSEPPVRLYYFATAPDRVGPAMDAMAKGGLIPNVGEQNQTRRYRIVAEKPFGVDEASAVELNEALQAHFLEDDIFRIDHYLGKETVQNLLYFRFANSVFEPVWNRQHVDHVQLTVAEDLGVMDRGGYYDQAGASRDMLQNHLMQLLCLVAMEPPATLTSRDLNDEKVKVLRALLPPQMDKICPLTVRAQYGPGVIHGKHTKGYRGETGVPPDSMTETYVALKLGIDNWRWAGVPFYVRTGKALKRKLSTMAIVFKRPPRTLFESASDSERFRIHRNVLYYRIAPKEGFALQSNVKEPGRDEATAVQMFFDYETRFPSGTPEAYERLLLDAVRGDTSLFIRGDQTEAAWRLIDAVRHCWAEDPRMPQYEPGSWGPKEADQLLEMDGNHWLTDDANA